MRKSTALVLTLFYLMFNVNSDRTLLFELKNAPQLYKDFIKRYNRTFDGEYDYNNRFKNFVRTLRYINTINSQSNLKEKVLPNKYADYSDAERRAYLRKNVRHIDPELRTILRMREEPKTLGRLNLGRTKKEDYGPYGKPPEE